jgi:TRAP-type mannitol/chloroaromatic compound transport system permease large subunit
VLSLRVLLPQTVLILVILNGIYFGDDLVESGVVGSVATDYGLDSEDADMRRSLGRYSSLAD